MPIDSVVTDRQPASIPPELQESIDRWAERQPASAAVSAILFGSRARGDYGPESDWDIALVYDGRCPQTSGMLSRLGDTTIDWVPLARSKAVRYLNVCGLPRAVAADGIVLHGDPLPRPERNDMNIDSAWYYVATAHGKTRGCVNELASYWRRAAFDREGENAFVAESSSKAGEFLCKAVLSLRGVEPRRSHSVKALCDDLENAFPSDPLLPFLRRCDGQTAKAHLGEYLDHRTFRESMGDPAESIEVSSERIANVLRATSEVAAAVADVSTLVEGRSSLESFSFRDAEVLTELDWLAATVCPPETLRRIMDGKNAGPSIPDLWERLEMPPLGRDAESEGRDWDPPGR